MHPIVRYRTARGLTQVDLAARVGVNVNSVRAWEDGVYPRARRFAELARVLEVDPVHLIGELDAWRQARARPVEESGPER